MGRDMNQDYQNQENLASASQRNQQQAPEDGFQLVDDESHYADQRGYLGINLTYGDETILVLGYPLWVWITLAAVLLIICLVFHFRSSIKNMFSSPINYRVLVCLAKQSPVNQLQVTLETLLLLNLLLVLVEKEESQNKLQRNLHLHLQLEVKVKLKLKLNPSIMEAAYREAEQLRDPKPHPANRVSLFVLT